MKEIKFRAFKNGIIDYNPEIPYSEQVDLNGQVQGLIDNNYTLMQYTGLIDKNGIEIYEGDIIKLKRKIGVVKYYLEMAGFEAATKDDYILGIHFKKSEVIGNIYKNKELLNEN